jgi:amidase
VDAEVEGVLRAAVDALRRAGVAVDETARPPFGFDEVLDVYLRLVVPILMLGVPDATLEGLAEAARARGSQDVSARVSSYAVLRHREWLAANEARERLRGALADFFRSWDVLLCPVAQVAAIPHDHSAPAEESRIRVNGGERPYHELFAWIALASATGLPATAAPVGRTRTGLPVGIQIVGPYLEDRTSLEFARALAGEVGGFEAPPGFGA